MRFQIRAVLACSAAVCALAACGSSSKSSGAAPTNPPTQAPTTAAPPTTVAAAKAPVTVDEAMNAKIKKNILVDGKGMTLYVWDKDTTPGKATCSGPCATAWPAVYATAKPMVGPGVNAAMFSLVTAVNGQKQLAVDGKPLYYWIGDKAKGDVNGNGVNSFYVVGTNGKKIDES
jgi:predicted lipoprotein with Yx(FWY)xxD motif